MIRISFVLAALSAAACASASPPAGPKHVPTDSAESETACPDQRAKAQKARENLLGEDLAGEQGIALNRAAAAAVFGHAECEAGAFAKLPSPNGSHDQILAGLRAMRGQMQDANNLFQEVLRYDLGAFAIRSTLAQAELKLAFASIVSKVKPPADLDIQSRSAFESELADATRLLRLEASGILETALGDIGTDPGASELKRKACELWAATGASPNPACA
jgi:hypothetical protein